MLTSAHQLKQKLATDAPVVGIMATDFAVPILVETCQNAGLDYLIIDSEHGCFSDETVAQICQVGRLANFPILVRTISTETSVIRRTIDLGPSGILLPNIETTKELDQVQNAILMPPRGRRRPGGMGNYWMKNFNYESWRDDLEEHFIVIPQIESQAGVDNALALASHPIVTALGVGPYDLSADLGCCWNPDDAKFNECLAKIKSAADDVGKKVWIGTNTEKYRAEGYTFLWVGTFTSVLTGALSQAVESLKEKPTDITHSNDPPPA